MAFALIVALLVSVLSLGWLVMSQSKTIEEYEKELINKARKGKNVSRKSKK